MKTAEKILKQKGYEPHDIANNILPELDMQVREMYGVEDHPLHLYEHCYLGDADEEEVLHDANNNTVNKFEDIGNLLHNMTESLNELAEMYQPQGTSS